jgi:hypothetical protein
MSVSTPAVRLLSHHVLTPEEKEFVEMFRRLALKALLTAGLTTTFAAAANQPAPEMNTLNPPFAVYLFSSFGFQFCDFFLITKNGLLAGGTHNLSTFCGLPDGLVSGNFNLAWGTPPYSSVPDHAYNLNSTVNAAFGQGLFYLFDTQKVVWANYGWDGTTLFLLNSGPYVIGAPPAAGAAKPSGKASSQKQ